MMLQYFLALLVSSGLAFSADAPRDYRVLATNKTSTMEKELNEGAKAGYHFEATMGGESAFAGSEVIVIMSKDRTAPSSGRYVYKLLATNKTSTMQKELQEAGREGFQYKGQTIFKTAFGSEVRKSLPFWKPIDKLRQRSDTTTNSSPPLERPPCRKNFRKPEMLDLYLWE